MFSVFRVTVVVLTTVLVQSPLLAQSSAISSMGLKALAKTGAKKALRVPFLGDGAAYLIDPDSASLRGSIEEWVSMAGVGETSNCDTVKCTQFVSNCARQLGLKETASVKEVFRTASSLKCIDDFFAQPLEKQSELRADGNLNRILNAFAPEIVNLSCSSRGVHVEAKGVDTNIFSYQINFDKIGAIKKISSLEDVKIDHLLFDQKGSPQLLQHCDSIAGCKNFTIADIESRMLYLWRDRAKMKKVLTKPDYDTTQKNNLAIADTPVDSFKWARMSLPLVKKNARQIYECCESASKSCQKFFAGKVRPVRTAQHQKVSSKLSAN